ncbi:MAG: hypothetical protein ACWA5R_08210 [bacterium]
MGSTVALSVAVVAALIMLFCLYQVISIGKQFSGGMIGKQWSYLTGLVVLFTLGYIALPFFGKLPPETMQLVVSLVFLFGAVYVFITIKLIKTVVDILSS